MDYDEMKILHVISHMAPRFGGPSAACDAYCRSLAAANVDVTLYTTNRDYPQGTLSVPLEEPVARNGYTQWNFPVTMRLTYGISPGLWRQLARTAGQFDLIHIHGLYSFPSLAAAWHARRVDVPYVQRLQGSLDPYLYHGKRTRLRKRIYERLFEFPNLNRAAAIHYTSNDERDLVSFLGLKAPAMVVPLGLDLQKYTKLPPYGRFRAKFGLENRKIILHFGRITQKKGLDLLAKAAGQLARKHHDLTLVIAGPDNEGFRPTVEGWLSEAGMLEDTLFTGMLTGNDGLSVLRDADVFALPSYTENFGIAVVDAAASGLPVVISDAVNIHHEVTEAGAGIVVPCNAEATAHALGILLDDPSLRQSMGDKGRQLVHDKFEMSSVATKLIDAYHNIIDRS
jgi:glycosyltransferase involved in cell wall biosynthesis